MKWVCAFLFGCFAWSLAFADDAAPYDYNPDLIAIDGSVLFFDVQGPAAYASSTPRDLPFDAVEIGPVQGQACQHGVSLPFTANLKAQSGKVSGAFGAGGYEAALKKVRKEHPDIQGIYDVRVDLHTLTVLSIYYRLCTEISARGFK